MSLDTVPFYRYRERRYPWAEANIQRAEARHGPVQPVCLCGAPVSVKDGRIIRCAQCGRAPTDPATGPGMHTRCGECGYLAVRATARSLSVRPCRCPGGPVTDPGPILHYIPLDGAQDEFSCHPATAAADAVTGTTAAADVTCKNCRKTTAWLEDLAGEVIG